MLKLYSKADSTVNSNTLSSWNKTNNNSNHNRNVKDSYDIIAAAFSGLVAGATEKSVASAPPLPSNIPKRGEDGGRLNKERKKNEKKNERNR